ncbi:MAG: V-type ATP synthase subunit D [Candidatus Zixiibacteriota bacterium]|nr:MAG: V-type ATP synthase subunit D [candidate division Zixibacteria bacterium]
MGKVRFTTGELKRQRDALRQYRRYLPTLQLKKQQLQVEIFHQHGLLKEKKQAESKIIGSIRAWAGLLVDYGPELREWVRPKEVITGCRNVAGVDLPFFERVEFEPADYDLFVMPLWVDTAVEELRTLVSLTEEILIIEQGVALLQHELRITTQRVNLFEKVKIPEAEEAIRQIKIYLGDQMTLAVGRSKIAKRKIEANSMAGVSA